MPLHILDYKRFIGAMIRLILALAVVLSLVLACNGASDVTRMGTEGAYEPYNYINDAGELVGFELELGDELCRRAELECEWVTNEWETIIPNLVDGQYDTILAGMSITDERDELIDFTQAYTPPSPSVYIAAAGAGDDAVNGRVAAQVATIHADYLAESGATLIAYKLAEDLVSAVLSGEADAGLVDQEFAHESVVASGNMLIVVGPEVPLDSGIGIGVREDDTDLKNALNEAIDSMKADGSLNALIRNWFDEDAKTF